ncbi:MAG TPA: hypothetical protein VM621_11305 [Luteibacter sp.]|uniref:hypothetical protein n=1 Tax=Luteibacter sp. TaxID=1886636 RepID=UPI002D0E2E07|nr:hypothetical protein [Luteibacter sp.]HVI55618.1 hypothetical protein [Luteibacter sp.]
MGNYTTVSTRLAPHRRRAPLTSRREQHVISADDGVQLNRRANLRGILIELDWTGVCSYENQASFLGLGKRQVLTEFLRGVDITTAVARDIEWAMQKRRGWMDEDHRGEPLDD